MSTAAETLAPKEASYAPALNRPILSVLFAYPPSGLYDRTDRCQTPIEYASAQGARPPLDIAYMAGSVIPEGVACHLIDYPMEERDFEDLRQDIVTLRPDMLVISITSFGFDLDMEACRNAKEVRPEIVTVAKGAHFKLAPEECLRMYPQLDISIYGESECVLPEILTAASLQDVPGIAFRAADGEVHTTAPRPVLRDLARLPKPARHLMDNERYRLPNTGEMMTTVIVGRGCPHSCVFCLVPTVTGKKALYRPVDDVVDEIAECVNRFGIRQFLLKADSFTINRKWVLDFCEDITSRGLDVGFISNSRVDNLDEELVHAMRRAGWWMLAMGIESGSEEILTAMQKAANREQARNAVSLCRKAGIRSFCYFTIGFPDDTKETILQTIRFAIELDGDFCEFHPCFPFPGTELHRQGMELGLIHEDAGAGRGVMPNQFMRTRTLTLEQINRLRIYGLARFYLRPRYIWRTLLQVSGPAEVGRYVYYASKKIWTTLRYSLSQRGW